MQKRHLITILAAFLIVPQLSFAMHGAIFGTARLVGVATLPFGGWYIAHQLDEDEKSSAEQLKKLFEIVRPFPDAVDNWGKEKIKKLNIADEEISLQYGSGWKSTAKAIHISPLDAFSLNNALITREKIKKTRPEILKERNALNQNNIYHRELIKSYDEIMSASDALLKECDEEEAKCSIILKHEAGHHVHGDVKNQNIIFGSFLIGTEIVSFGTTYGVNTLVKRNKVPKTLMSTVARSSLAVGAIIPKVVINLGGFFLYKRHREKKADQYAYEHAESRLELQAAIDDIKDHEGDWGTSDRRKVWLLEAMRDPIHPCPQDRRKMPEKYLLKWDAEHKE